MIDSDHHEASHIDLIALKDLVIGLPRQTFCQKTLVKLLLRRKVLSSLTLTV